MASPPNTPEESISSCNSPINIQSPSERCICGGSVPLMGSLVANTLADSLGVSPLYKQQDSARWSTAAQVYRSSRCHSPTGGTPFTFPDTAPGESIPFVNPQQLNANLIHSISKTPILLEEIAEMNRRRHEEQGGVVTEGEGGPLELEAIAAVHELCTEVQSISVSEMLPRTSDLIFVNVKTQEGQPYTLELTLKGWRIASSHTDCMNGDYTKVALHTRYYHNARELLSEISPDHCTRFNECVAQKLEMLQNGGQVCN